MNADVASDLASRAPRLAAMWSKNGDDFDLPYVALGRLAQSLVEVADADGVMASLTEVERLHDEGLSQGERPTSRRWLVLSLGGAFLTLLGAGLGSQLVLSLATPGPAAPYAATTIGLAVLSLVAATLILGKLIGVRTRGEWARALVSVAIPVAAAILLVGLIPRGE